MPWLPYSTEAFPDGTAAELLQHIQTTLTPQEQFYVMTHVEKVIFKPVPKGNGGSFNYKTGEVFVNTTSEETDPTPLSDIGQIAFTLAHEIRHPLLRLAAQDCIGGYFIINSKRRKEAQEKAKALAPEAVAEMEEFLASGADTRPDWKRFTPQERLATELYMIMDDRYYDLFGDATSARFSGRGYTNPTRDHEVGCNLTALQAIEETVTGEKPHLVEEMAGPILELIHTKVAASLKRNPNRTPVQIRYNNSPPPGGGG